MTVGIAGSLATDPATLLLNTASQINATGAGGVNFGDHEATIATFGTSTFNGNLAGSQGLTKMGWGTLVLSSSTATMNYPGVTRIEQGTITLNANNQLPTSTDLVFSGAPNTTAANNPTLNLNGKVQNVNSVNTLNNANAIGTSARRARAQHRRQRDAQDQRQRREQLQRADHQRLGHLDDLELRLRHAHDGNPQRQAADRSATMTYNKLWVSNGGTVVLPVSDFNAYPAAAGTPLVDAFLLDNGTLSFPGILGTNIGADTTTVGQNFILNTSRGIRINAGGGTLDVQNPYLQMSLSGNGALSGTATLTKTGAGILVLPAAASATQARLKLRVLGGDVIFPADTSMGVVPTAFQSDAITLDNGGAIDASAAVTINVNRGITVGPGRRGASPVLLQRSPEHPQPPERQRRTSHHWRARHRRGTFSGISDARAGVLQRRRHPRDRWAGLRQRPQCAGRGSDQQRCRISPSSSAPAPRLARSRWRTTSASTPGGRGIGRSPRRDGSVAERRDLRRRRHAQGA